MMLNAFKPLEKFDTSSSSESIKKAIDHLIAMADKESAYLEEVNKQQREYGRLNGFTIE
jgi:hypothetical protein